jgi:hypothetical protein
MPYPSRIPIIAAITLALLVGLLGSADAQSDQSAQINTQQDVVNRQGLQGVGQPVPFRITVSDLGEIDVVSRVPRPAMFTFGTLQSFNYTTNAFLTQSNERDAFFWNGRLFASFVPYSTRDFTPRLTFTQDFFRYTRFSTLDFDSQTLQLDLKFDLNKSDTWFVGASYLVSRLYSPRGSAGEFYRYGLANVNINYDQPLGDLPLYAFWSAGFYSRQGDPSSFDRIAPYINSSLVYRPINSLQISGFIHPELQFYTNDPHDSSRKDFNLSIGSAVSWTPSDYFALGASVTFVGNYSDEGGASYNVFSPSVAVGGRVSF